MCFKDKITNITFFTAYPEYIFVFHAACWLSWAAKVTEWGCVGFLSGIFSPNRDDF
jgi:hypothetical protein